MSAPRLWAVVPAAGSGRRLGATTPKQFLPINGRSVLAHSLDALLVEPRIEAVAVALDPAARVDLSGHGARVLRAAGGAERADSVLNALEALGGRAADDDWVLVHDAARPCLHRDDLRALIEALAGDPVGGLLAVPARDTVKRADAGSGERGPRVAETLDRRDLWLAQTPQMFRYGLLRQALVGARAEGREVTDEAAAVEAGGQRPRLVAASHDNLKITYPEDLAMAAAVLQAREVAA